MSGLRRAIGLHMLNFTMNLNYSRKPFFDMLQWFQAALRRNKVTSGAHYLSGLEGCSLAVQQSI